MGNIGVPFGCEGEMVTRISVSLIHSIKFFVLQLKKCKHSVALCSIAGGVLWCLLAYATRYSGLLPGTQLFTPNGVCYLFD